MTVSCDQQKLDETFTVRFSARQTKPPGIRSQQAADMAPVQKKTQVTHKFTIDATQPANDKVFDV